MSVPKKRKTEGSEVKLPDSTSEAKENLPDVVFSAFKPVPASSSNIILASESAGKRGVPYPLCAVEAKSIPEPHLWDPIVPVLQFNSTALAQALAQNRDEIKDAAQAFSEIAHRNNTRKKREKAKKEGKEVKDEEEKAELQDHKAILKMQSKILSHPIVAGYRQLPAGWTFYKSETLLGAELFEEEENSIFSKDGGNCLKDIRLDSSDEDILEMQRHAIVQVCIEAFLIINKRVLVRTDGDFSKPQFLFVFFASDFPVRGFDRGEDRSKVQDLELLRTDSLAAIIEAQLKYRLIGAPESFLSKLHKHEESMWRKDWQKGERVV